GANGKCEVMSDVCRVRGLDEQQGVLIPTAKVQLLILREAVFEPARHRQFAIYPVTTVDEAIEILTGIKAGERGPEGRFPAGTLNRLGGDKLKNFAEKGRGVTRATGNAGGSPRGAERTLTLHRTERTAGAWCCSWGRRTPASLRWRRPCASLAPSNPRLRASSSRTSNFSTALPTILCARYRSPAGTAGPCQLPA